MHGQIEELTIAFLEREVATAVRLQIPTEENRLRDQIRGYQEAHDADLDTKIREHNASRDEPQFRGWTDQQIVDEIECRCAIDCVQEELNDHLLFDLAAEQITEDDIDDYTFDEKYGPYGFREDYFLKEAEEGPEETPVSPGP